MRKLSFVFLTVLLITIFALMSEAAIIKYQATVLDGASAAKGAAITVYLYDTGTPATLYWDATGKKSIGNPVTTDGNGLYWFYVEEGEYDIYAIKSGMTTQAFRDVSIALPLLSTGSLSLTNLNTSGTVTAGTYVGITQAMVAGLTTASTPTLAGAHFTTIPTISGALTSTCTGTSVTLVINNGLITSATCTP